MDNLTVTFEEKDVMSDDDKKLKKGRPIKIKTEKKYTQRYRSKWEKDSRFKGWLQPVPGDVTKAKCTVCATTMQAHLRSILGHSSAKKHLQLAGSSENRAQGAESPTDHGSDEENFHYHTFAGGAVFPCTEVHPSSGQNELGHGETKTILQQPRIRISGGSGAIPDEQCHTFAGGAVYPNTEGRASGHNLQWTKALISRPAPSWEATAVIDGQFKELKLQDYRGKYLVFFFYPLDFTFVCPTEILAFNDRVEEFRAINTEVVACSIDSHFTHLAWTNTQRKDGGLGKLNIPLLSDITHKISIDYGVYLENQGIALRGLFIVDDKGILRQITMNDLPVGRSVDETLRLVQAFQFTDQHGEVCPAGWKPGDDTIIPTPKEKLKYFKKANEKK